MFNEARLSCPFNPSNQNNLSLLFNNLVYKPTGLACSLSEGMPIERIDLLPLNLTSCYIQMKTLSSLYPRALYRLKGSALSTSQFHSAQNSSLLLIILALVYSHLGALYRPKLLQIMTSICLTDHYHGIMIISPSSAGGLCGLLVYSVCMEICIHIDLGLLVWLAFTGTLNLLTYLV